MEELERGPFGQALSLWLHRFPRNSGEDWDWELDRGFHLQVLGESLFEVNLRPRNPSSKTTLALLADSSTEGLSRFLVWQKSATDHDWEEFSTRLARFGRWRAGLILSHLDQRAAIIGGHFSHRQDWKEVDCPVIHLFQHTPPPENYFTVEKNLFVLGRVGRRLRRYARWRRRLPW